MSHVLRQVMAKSSVQQKHENYGICFGLELTSDPHITCSSNCKDKKEENESKCFQIVCSNTLHSKQYSPQKLSL